MDEPLLDFREVMRRLRAECPWKAEQTHRSLARYLLEETHETLEAIEAGDPAHLREELGDLLLQVYFHAVVAEESGDFTLDDVARGITEKMHRRNPHVFGRDGEDPPEDEGLDAAAVNDAWQRIKADEKALAREVDGRVTDGRVTDGRVTDGLPPTLPALLHADKVLDRLARERGAPVRVEVVDDDLGDRLLALVAEARAADRDPEQALRDAVRRLLAR